MLALKVTFVVFILLFQFSTGENGEYDDFEDEFPPNPSDDYDDRQFSRNHPPNSKRGEDDGSDDEFPPNPSDDYDDSPPKRPSKPRKGNYGNDEFSGYPDYDEGGFSMSSGSNSKMRNSRGGCNKCGIGYGGSGGGRVINGKPVKPVYKYPWIVSLIKGQKLSCGGALISASFVLTAGHCVFNKPMLRNPRCRGKRVAQSCLINPSSLKIGLTTSQRPGPSESMAVRRITSHPMYSYTGKMHDVALIQLARPVRCGPRTMPICLPKRDFKRPGQQLIIAGYGKNTPDGTRGPQILREGKVKEIDPRRCVQRDQPRNVINSIVCMVGMETRQSSCHGDSGSSLFGRFGNKYYSVGIVSFGMTARCSPRIPVTYMKTYFSLNFIRQHVRDLPQV